MAVAPGLAASVAAAHFAEPKNVLARNVIANDLIKPGFADQPIADLLIDRDARIGAIGLALGKPPKGQTTPPAAPEKEGLLEPK